MSRLTLPASATEAYGSGNVTKETKSKDEGQGDGQGEGQDDEVKGAEEVQDEQNGDAKETEAEAEEKNATTNGSSTTEKPTNGSSAVEKGERKGVPSNILEKGIIYFFFRGRVGIDEPESVDDLRRTYFVLRPINKDAKLGEGTIGDAGNSRLIAIPN